MKITAIDIIPIRAPLARRYAGREVFFHGIDRRTIYKIQTDKGLVGYGDHRLSTPTQVNVASLIGRDPFDLSTTTSIRVWAARSTMSWENTWMCRPTN